MIFQLFHVHQQTGLHTWYKLQLNQLFILCEKMIFVLIHTGLQTTQISRKMMLQFKCLTIVSCHIFYILFLSVNLQSKFETDTLISLITVCICMLSLVAQSYVLEKYGGATRLFFVLALLNEVSVGVWASRQLQVYQALNEPQKIVDLICLSLFGVCNVWGMLPAARWLIDSIKDKRRYTSYV